MYRDILQHFELRNIKALRLADYSLVKSDYQVAGNVIVERLNDIFSGNANFLNTNCSNITNRVGFCFFVLNTNCSNITNRVATFLFVLIARCFGCAGFAIFA